MELSSDFTDLEKRLIEAALNGTVLELEPHPAAKEVLQRQMQEWGTERHARASVIRDLLLGRVDGGRSLDPRGVRASGVTVRGHLDLSHLTAVVPLALEYCNVPDGINATSAIVPGLDLSGSCLTAASGECPLTLINARVEGQLLLAGATITNSDGPALFGDRLAITGGAALNDGFEAVGTGPDGAIRLLGAAIRGQLNLRGARVANDSGPALGADGLLLSGDAALDGGFAASGAGERGVLRLVGVRVEGQLTLSGAHLKSSDGPALDADGLVVTSSAFLDKGFHATGAGSAGTIRLLGARIEGQLLLTSATLINTTGPALVADGVDVRGSAFLGAGFKATGSGQGGAVRFPGAQVGRQLDLGGATLTNQTGGPALHADRLQVAGDAYLDSGFTASANAELGTVRLLGARIDGQLSMRGAVLTNPRGPALDADRLVVAGGARWSGLNASGAGDLGSVRIPGARIDGHLNFSGATITNSTSGPALHADRLVVTGDVHFRNGFQATGAGEQGAVRLPSAQISGYLNFRGATLTSSNGPALAGDRLAVSGNAFFNRGFTATSTGADAAVRLLSTHIGGVLSLRGASISNVDGTALNANGLVVTGDAFLDDGFQVIGAKSAELVRLREGQVGGLRVSSEAIRGPARWVVDGLTYPGYPSVGYEEWLAFLRNGTAGYAPQPYQQLASVARSAGHDRDARTILMAQRKDQIARGGLRPAERTWAKVTGATIGYGYQPWRALLWLGAVLSVALITVFFLLPDGLAHTPQAGATAASVHRELAAGTACGTTERALVAVDLAIPLVTTGIRDTCWVTHTTEGTILTASAAIFQLLSWGLAALFAAGFTGAIRKT